MAKPTHRQESFIEDQVYSIEVAEMARARTRLVTADPECQSIIVDRCARFLRLKLAAAVE